MAWLMPGFCALMFQNLFEVTLGLSKSWERRSPRRRQWSWWREEGAHSSSRTGSGTSFKALPTASQERQGGRVR